jgi:hypothetical protein
MTVTTARSEIKRISVALDVSSGGQSMLPMVADLAAALQAELEGVFVEDINLANFSSLPFMREIRTGTLTEDSISADSLRRSLRATARLAEQMLEHAARSAGIRSSFRIWQGEYSIEALSQQLQSDILGLLRLGKSHFAPAQPVLSVRSTSLLTVNNLSVLYRAAPVSEKVLEVARRLSGKLNLPLRLLLQDSEQDEASTTRANELLHDQTRKSSVIEIENIADLSFALKSAGNTILISDPAHPLLREIEQKHLTSMIACPILIVR